MPPNTALQATLLRNASERDHSTDRVKPRATSTMEPYHAAFLRGRSNVAMRSFVDALERLGLTAVVSFGTSGDLLFHADAADSASLESRTAQAVGVEAFVRSRDELSAVVAQNPYSGRKGA